MQALFATYATSVKKPADDDQGGNNVSRFQLKVVEFVSRLCCPCDRTRAEDRNTEGGYDQEQERR